MQDVTNARLFIPGLTNLDVVSSLPPHVCVGNFLTAPILLDCQGRWEDGKVIQDRLMIGTFIPSLY